MAMNHKSDVLTDDSFVIVITDPENPKFDLEAFLQAKAVENP